MIADMLANNLIIGWVNGNYEIGPRALGNRSILASPFKNSTSERLNVIKQREQFRPIALYASKKMQKNGLTAITQAHLCFTHGSFLQML